MKQSKTKVVMIYPRPEGDMAGAIPEEFDYVAELRDPLEMSGLRRMLPHLGVGTEAFVKVFDDPRRMDMMRWADEFQVNYSACSMQIVDTDEEGKAVYLYFKKEGADNLKAELSKKRDSHYLGILEQELSKMPVE